MKSKIIFAVTLLVLTGIITMQSCKKESPVNPTVVLAAVPDVPVPSNYAVIPFTASGQAVNLAWQGTATNAVTWSVYFGKSSVPGKVATVTSNAYTAHIGTTGGKYYWQVVTTDANQITTTSPLWVFDVNTAPAVPVLTAPANAAPAVDPTTATLTWTATDPESDNLAFDVYFGTTATPALVATNVLVNTYTPTLAFNTTYYWKIVSKDPNGGVTPSPVYSFTTKTLVVYDFSVFNGVASEKCTTFSATLLHNVSVQVNPTAKTINLFLPIAQAMVDAGWGTVYTGTQSMVVSYDPITLVVTSAKQLWANSFIDPVEMGPMSLKVAAGSTIDPANKKILIKWTVSGNAYWGADYTLSTATYTML
jgi:hypothetical protein